VRRRYGRGCLLVNEGGNGVFSAELPGHHSIVLSSATPDGLVRAINAYEERTQFRWSTGPPIIHDRPLDLEDLEEMT